MSDTQNPIESGYVLERLFANELHFTGHPVDDSMPESEAKLEIGWDWTINGPAQFSVSLKLGVLPTKARPETIAVTLSAGFTRRGEPTVPLLEFVSKHGPALMMPYVREVVSSLTSRGLHGTLLLPPFNVLAMMSNLDPMDTVGMRQIQGDADLAATFGITATS